MSPSPVRTLAWLGLPTLAFPAYHTRDKSHHHPSQSAEGGNLHNATVDIPLLVIPDFDLFAGLYNINRNFNWGMCLR